MEGYFEKSRIFLKRLPWWAIFLILFLVAGSAYSVYAIVRSIVGILEEDPEEPDNPDDPGGGGKCTSDSDCDADKKCCGGVCKTSCENCETNSDCRDGKKCCADRKCRASCNKSKPSKSKTPWCLIFGIISAAVVAGSILLGYYGKSVGYLVTAFVLPVLTVVVLSLLSYFLNLDCGSLGGQYSCAVIFIIAVIIGIILALMVRYLKLSAKLTGVLILGYISTVILVLLASGCLPSFGSPCAILGFLLLAATGAMIYIPAAYNRIKLSIKNVALGAALLVALAGLIIYCFGLAPSLPPWTPFVFAGVSGLLFLISLVGLGGDLVRPPRDNDDPGDDGADRIKNEISTDEAIDLQIEVLDRLRNEIGRTGDDETMQRIDAMQEATEVTERAKQEARNLILANIGNFGQTAPIYTKGFETQFEILELQKLRADPVQSKLLDSMKQKWIQYVQEPRVSVRNTIYSRISDDMAALRPPQESNQLAVRSRTTTLTEKSISMILAAGAALHMANTLVAPVVETSAGVDIAGRTIEVAESTKNTGKYGFKSPGSKKLVFKKKKNAAFAGLLAAIIGGASLANTADFNQMQTTSSGATLGIAAGNAAIGHNFYSSVAPSVANMYLDENGADLFAEFNDAVDQKIGSAEEFTATGAEIKKFDTVTKDFLAAVRKQSSNDIEQEIDRFQDLIRQEPDAFSGPDRSQVLEQLTELRRWNNLPFQDQAFETLGNYAVTTANYVTNNPAEITDVAVKAGLLATSLYGNPVAIAKATEMAGYYSLGRFAQMTGGDIYEGNLGNAALRVITKAGIEATSKVAGPFAEQVITGALNAGAGYLNTETSGVEIQILGDQEQEPGVSFDDTEVETQVTENSETLYGEEAQEKAKAVIGIAERTKMRRQSRAENAAARQSTIRRTAGDPGLEPGRENRVRQRGLERRPAKGGIFGRGIFAGPGAGLGG